MFHGFATVASCCKSVSNRRNGLQRVARSCKALQGVARRCKALQMVAKKVFIGLQKVPKFASYCKKCGRMLPVGAKRSQN